MWNSLEPAKEAPEVLKEDVALNHETLELPDQFMVRVFVQKEHPTPEQIAANKVKWGLDPNT